MKETKTGQVAIEFVVLISLAFLTLLVYTYVTADNWQELTAEQEYALLRDTVYTVQSEILTASTVNDGYYRTFTVPELLDSRLNYTIEVSSGYLVASAGEQEATARIPPVTGQLQKGTNTISKTAGVVYLNS